ncbi:ThiF family adenylyltransferase [Paenibacillus sp. KS-LC4]|uniref:ThiF family adenylyltransferase n=1 Tax=Paenibacillus sp. KS-LC4 TaxID=2979727 RepID=UPI0030CD82A3
MDDRHSLEVYYDKVLQDVALHLTGNYGAQELKVINKTEFSSSYRIHKNGVAIDLLLPIHFPDVFPEVKIPNPYFSRIYPIPHLNVEHTLCIFDPEEAHPNPANPKGVVDAVIERAFDLIQLGVKRENSSDYLDEFDSYWCQHTIGNVLSLIEVNDVVREIHLIEIDLPRLGRGLLAVDSILKGMNWVKQIGGVSGSTKRKALYLPIKSFGIPPYPSSNGSLLKKIRETSPELISPLIEFLDKNKRPAMVLFSMVTPSGRVMGGWEHQEPVQINPGHRKNKRQTKRAMNGFRAGYKNARMEMNFFRLVKLNRYSVIRVEKDRLLTRGGDGAISTSARVGIVGCGSIGSQIANSLCDLGVDQLMLIDKDILTFENIARHLCGGNHVGKSKVEAINDYISSRLPYCRNNLYHDDVLNILRSDETLLNRCNLTIVAAAHLPTEFRLDELQRRSMINKPLLYVWVEPYLAAAHAVYIDPSKGGHFRDLFNENHQFIGTVLDSPGQYAIREAGCQSTYVPYSILEVKRFIHELMFLIQDILDGTVSNNVLFTWFGNLSLQKSFGRGISKKFDSIGDYSVNYTNVGDLTKTEVLKKC